MARSIVSAPSEAVTELLVNAPTPSYLVSVFAIAVVLRSCLTVPVQLWQRKRIERLNEVVNPEIKSLNDKIALQVLVHAKREGWSHEQYVAEVKKKVSLSSLGLPICDVHTPRASAEATQVIAMPAPC